MPRTVGPSLANEDKITLLALQTPRAQKNSYSSMAGAVPIVDSFVVGPENSIVRELFTGSGMDSLVSRSPIYLYGPSGVGKTALALTLAARWIHSAPQRTSTIVHAGDFAKQLVRSIDADDMPRFRTQHRDVDCLVVDNLQDLSGKHTAQSELVEILNAAEARGMLVIVTASVLPSLLSNWESSLASRLMAGYSLDVAYPGLAARLELFKRLANGFGATIEEADLQRLNQQLPENQSALQLKGLITRWVHQQKASETQDPALTRGWIASLATSNSPRVPTPMEIAKAVAKEMHQTLESMCGPSRKAGVVRARGLAMFLIRQCTDTSYQSIGELFGRRDHTTVMHACKKTEDDLVADHELSRSAERLKKKWS